MQGMIPARRFASAFDDESGPTFWQATLAAVLKALPEALSIPSMPAERHFVKGVWAKLGQKMLYYFL